MTKHETVSQDGSRPGANKGRVVKNFNFKSNFAQIDRIIEEDDSISKDDNSKSGDA
jgi:hypothetical protein